MMFSALAKGLFGDANDREVKKLAPQIKAINDAEAEMQALSDDKL